MNFRATSNPVLFTQEKLLWQCSNKFRSTLRICCKEKNKWQSQVSNSPFHILHQWRIIPKNLYRTQHMDYIRSKSIACNNHDISIFFFFTCQYYSLIFRYSFWDCCLKSVAFLMSASGPMIFCVSFWACRLKSVAVTAALSPRAQVNPVVTSIIGSSEYIRDIASSSKRVAVNLALWKPTRCYGSRFHAWKYIQEV